MQNYKAIYKYNINDAIFILYYYGFSFVHSGCFSPFPGTYNNIIYNYIVC